MTEIAVALLVLPDGRFVFQRRSKDAPISPRKLGFFGGHMEGGETPLEAVVRELGEETSLALSTDDFTSATTKHMMVPEGERLIHLFLAAVPNADFAVYEGDRAEVYSLSEMLNRTDIGVASRLVLEAVVDREYSSDGIRSD